MSYGSTKIITIDGSKVSDADSADLTNFPFLFKGTFDYLATVANGGFVENANGYDIIFTSDQAGTNQLDHEIEYYNPATGECIFWVRIPTLAYDDDTVIYLQYGNSSISTSQENVTGTWESNYKAVYHCKEIDGSNLLQDSTSNNNDLTCQSGVSEHSPGKIGDDVEFDASADGYAEKTSPNNIPSGTGPLTLELIFKPDSSAVKVLFGCGENTTAEVGDRIGITILSTTGMSIGFLNIARYFNWTYSTDYHHIMVAVPNGGDITNCTIVIDGVEVSHTGDSGNMDIDAVYIRLSGIVGYYPATYNFDGACDEARIATVERGASWGITCYNNYFSPSTFFAVTSVPPPTEIRANRSDISGNARHLADVGTVAVSNIAGKIGTAAYFDGTGNQSLQIGSAPDLTSNVDFAIAIWFEMSLTGGAPGTDINFHFDIGDANVELGFKSGQTVGYASIDTPSLSCATGNIISGGVKHCIIFYYDGAKLAIRLDDTLVDSDNGVSNGIASPASEVEMGFDAAVAMTFALDEPFISVDSGMLTTDQMAGFWNNGNGARPSFS